MPITKSSYGMRMVLHLPYVQAVEKVTAALKEQGFGVLTTIDVRKTIREKLDQDFRNYVILGACNPQLSHQALTDELEVGLLLSCNVIVYEEEGSSVVSILDPIQMMGLAANPSLEPIAGQAKKKLEQVLISLENR